MITDIKINPDNSDELILTVTCKRPGIAPPAKSGNHLIGSTGGATSFMTDWGLAGATVAVWIKPEHLKEGLVTKAEQATFDALLAAKQAKKAA